ncbi:hydroxymethylbilane synthase [uncultured Sphingomonas sp.]|uniref:hydroxymethylbilane synthase n=1 Tax=uncultured Sphingomonas sp. TaxID=158754 RepID=UPI00262F4B2B|nr:hydroxymethylbilane synthase [uncultured Sphingomonas sp.]
MTFRLGTRASPLALTQAEMVRDALVAAHPGIAVELVPMRTTGDRVQDRALAEIGGKGLWTKELDRALLAGEVDACVHSGKDVETIRPAEIAIAAMLPRADVRDRLIGAPSIAALAAGAVVGTSSPRRRAQLLHLRPDLRTVLFRGNVATRLARLEAGEADATLLAAAGLDRLGRHDLGSAISIDEMLPAPSQAAVAIEVRAGSPAAGIVAVIDDAPTSMAVRAERALLAAFHAGCHSPVGALARIVDGRVVLRAQLLSEDGAETIAGELSGAPGEDIAGALARDLLARAPAAVKRLFGG